MKETLKETLIQSLIRTAGIDRQHAEGLYEVFRDKLYGPFDPTPEQVAQLSISDLGDIPAGNRKTIWAAIARAIPPAEASTSKRRWKAEKARAYTAADLAAFVAADPGGKADGLRAEIERRTGGAPFRFLVGGELDEEQTAARIEALFQRDPVAPFVVIDGADVTPVGWEEADIKKDDEDPFQRGAALGQPGEVSPRLGVSLTGISHETRQAIDCAMQNDLFDASTRELIQIAEGAKGKTPEDVLESCPNARRAWPTWNRRPLKVTRPFAKPTPQAPVADRGTLTLPGSVYVFGANLEPSAWESLQKHTAAISGVRLESRRTLRAGALVEEVTAQQIGDASMFIALVSANTMADKATLAAMTADHGRRPLIPVLVSPCFHPTVLRRQQIKIENNASWVLVAKAIADHFGITEVAAVAAPDHNDIANAIAKLGIERSTLFLGIDRQFSATLPIRNSPAAQNLSDVGALLGVGTLLDGSDPWRTYLENALRASAGRREGEVFRRALAAL